MLNTPGTVDSCYRGEVCVILVNLGNKKYLVEKGKKIAQLVVSRVEEAAIAVVEELDGTTRGAGGFGSTGLAKKEGTAAAKGGSKKGLGSRGLAEDEGKAAAQAGGAGLKKGVVK